MILALKILAVIYFIGGVFLTMIYIGYDGYKNPRMKLLRTILWPCFFFFGG